MKTLIVEDNSTVRQVLEEQIHSYGYEVTACANAESALEVYQQTFYPLIVLDLGLPGMDGLEFCRRIRSLPQGDRSMILVVTRRHKLEDLQAALEAGADDYLIKPVSMDLLSVRLTIIEQWFRKRAHRKQAEETILQQKEFLEYTLESLTHPFYVIDPNDYTIKLANSAAAIYGIPENSTYCYAMTHKRNTPCDEDAEHPCPIKVVKKTRKPFTVEHIHHDKDGNAKHVEVYAYPIFDQQGNVIQIIEYSLDITERKQIEESLRNSLAALEQSEEEKAIFIRTMIHELKSPVAATKMMADLLTSYPLENPKVASMPGRISARMDQLLELIKDMLDLLRVKSGIPLGDITVLDLVIETENASKPYMTQAAEKGLSMRIECYEKSLPVRFDSRGYNLMLSNLISNAVKFTNEGSVKISLKRQNSWVVLEVEDSGIGIPEADIPQLFKEFFRASNAMRNKIQGSGVGLAGAKHIVERFGGELELQSRENEGSIFTVRLPLYSDP